MEILQTAIPEVKIVRPRVFADDRGFFLEAFRASAFAAAGIAGTFVQDNHSGSRRHVLRGLHYQVRRPQGKLVRAVTGEIFDVAVDLRRASPTFGRWVGEILSAENKAMLWVPPGFAHGFLVLSEWADVIYKTTEYYAPELERTIVWNDPALAVGWPLAPGETPLASAKDAAGARLEEAELYE